MHYVTKKGDLSPILIFMLQVSIQNYLSPTPEFTTVFCGVRVAHFYIFCVVLLCVFAIWVPYCDVCCGFRSEQRFGSSLPRVVCRRAHVLFTLLVFVCVRWCPTHIVLRLCLLCLSSSCVPYVASFSGLSIFDCSFGIL